MTEQDGVSDGLYGERTLRNPDALIRRAGLRGDPDQDQHFLVDDRVLDRVPSYLPDDTDTSHVLEVGPGTGALTDRLLAVADRVTVVERDVRLADFLRREFADEIDAGRLTVLEGDALEVDLPEFTACVANLPYGISSEITFRLLPEGKPLVLMFQKEFAERMAADPATDAYGRLSVSAQHYADVEVVEPVPPTAFSPPPAVDSAVVRTTPRDPDYEVDDPAFFLDFVKALFTQRRKTIRNGIRNTTHITGIENPEAVVDAVEAYDEVLLRKRAGKLAPAQFAELAAVAADVERRESDA
ncbi:16S rRNA (adenine1518-N6/adenine1519-N6)-dimethyltransferase [Halogranum amylolyticum]|uniref:Probable ribosomal RNA small subunit methyltransferase A n=1 Tax=Halogranum amylolyticum TaxID=660520 RepID=A0A1H8RWQ7_9EURY|nr:16S ribosomal RNA methyltransferase A [Halogranum amylolyticum]SEO70598.1 16S rRNA (adenine1518-N6/adenine1519-N6)-dimethyltransferase [Halogranum amylolyticum]